MAKLGEVCKVSPSTKNIERQGAWLLNLDMVEQQTGRVIEYKYVGEDDLNGSIIQFDTENVLYSKLRPNLNKVVLPQKDGFSTSELLPLRPDASVLNRDYLAVFLRSDSFVTWAVSKTAGAKMPRLGTKDLMNAEIPVPTIEQQKTIAEKFKKLEQLISLRKQQITKLDELVKARFVEMFENVTEKNALENLCHFIDYRGKTPEKSDSGLPFITAKNIRMHYMSFSTQEFISKENYDKVMTRGIPKVGDVVFTTEAPLGNVCRIPQFDTDFYIGQRIITMQTKLLNPVYLEYALSSDDFKRKLVGKSSGSTVTGIRSKLLGKLTIPVPSKGLQNQFAAFVERVDQQKQTVQQSLEKLELMKKVLMQEYFG